MWLLETSSFRLKEFIGSQIPKYVILSHTWGDEEVTFQDMQDLDQARLKKGFQKILGCCDRARTDGFQWVWVDTCSIDKSSSAEMSEAINSMYQFYSDAQICYVHLADVPDECVLDGSCDVSSLLKYSRWFKRGWTLQELIAPSIVEFYSAGWREIGTRLSLLKDLLTITRIDEDVLRGTKQPTELNVACRMSWAAGRETTRLEDRAYSLLGIFQVNMPLLYGEGPRAFRRLQEAIMNMTEDYTIFAWNWPRHSNELIPGAHQLGSSLGILASSPDRFDEQQFQELVCMKSYSTLQRTTRNLHFQPRLGIHNLLPGGSLSPPILTSRGITMDVLIVCTTKTINHQKEHYCLTWSESDGQILLLCISLNRFIQQGALKNEHPVYTRPRTGTSRWLYPVNRDDVLKTTLEYRTIQWAPAPKEALFNEPSGTNNSRPVWLSLSTSTECRVIAWLLPSAAQTCSPSEVPQTFELGRLLRYFRDPMARAGFAITCSIPPDVTLHFVVVFGFVGRRIPLCGLFRIPSSKAGALIERASDYNEATFSRFYIAAHTKGPSQSLVAADFTQSQSAYSRLLRANKDRIEEVFDGMKLKVSARRQFAQVRPRFSSYVQVYTF